MTYTDNIEGQIERITFANPETGYTIAKIRISGTDRLITVTGNLMSLAPGEMVKVQGEWINHPKFGHQLKAASCERLTPATREGIEKYLGSGMIKGIGPAMAGRMMASFGIDVLDIIENDIDRLDEVPGIGPERKRIIKEAWDSQKQIRNVMLFLQSYDVSATFAAKIFRRYGNSAIQIVKDNPYRLAEDIPGIGFSTADQIAQKMGIPHDSQDRCAAGILYLLKSLANEGHVYFPYEPLLKKSEELLGVQRKLAAETTGELAVGKKVIIEDLNQSIVDFRENNKAVYLNRLHCYETGISKILASLSGTQKEEIPDIEQIITNAQHELDINLAKKQIEAIRAGAREKVLIITGGPGTGKTTIIKAITKIHEKAGRKVLLAAPTGRAAKRLSEATGYDAKTIHRLLEYQPKLGKFKKSPQDPLKTDLLIIDEASMIDTGLMFYLAGALPLRSALILVGDINQLPSVGPGNVLRDMIFSGTLKVVQLNEIFRQKEESLIVLNAHRINDGVMPAFSKTPEKSISDFYFIEEEDPEKILKRIVRLVRKDIPDRFGFDSLEEIQILTPMYKGTVGANNLNAELQKEFNSSHKEVSRNGILFRLNDKVMQIRNNYEKDVFNGDIGRMESLDLESQQATVVFEGRQVHYDFPDLDELTPAYAISVHKSQGSEYPAVIIPVVTQHYMMLQRNLIYTALTRAKKLAILIGSSKALAMAVRNNKVQKRFTGLEDRLRQAF